MKTIYRSLAAIILFSLFSLSTYAQTATISGNVKSNPGNENVSAVSILVKGTTIGAYTDDRGNFKISGALKFPVTLVVSSVGYGSKEIAVASAGENVKINLDQVSSLAQEVVVSASRLPERILESPVSIERVSAANIRNAATPSYYDLVGYLKGVDMTTSSFAFRTPSTRGFNGSGNLRFNQLVDGMDNQAPALNFAVGSIIGLTELDVDNMELLPGASSALYGSGGMNGTLLINSKNPFKYQGLSVQAKQGVNQLSSSQRSAAPYYDYSLRFGKKLSEKFAFKLSAQYIKAQDWQGTDTRNLKRENVISSLKDGSRETDHNYDGVNVFGDEASASMDAFSQAYQAQTQAGILAATGGTVDIIQALNTLPANPTPQQLGQFLGQFPAQLQPSIQNLLPFYFGSRNKVYGGQSISRTGYDEKYLVNYDSYNARFSAGLNYKITNDIEASFLGYYGVGTSVYTGADRYSLKNLKMGQYKLELKSKNWFVRGYTTQENSGDSYTATTSALFINNAWKKNSDWFGQYTGNYAGARLQGASDVQAHSIARQAAETGRYLPGTVQFDSAFNAAIGKDINSGGAKFADKSSMYHYEGQYNFKDFVKFAEVLVGANYRHFSLNSKGTIFADTSGAIGINEYGSYLQVQKKLLKDILKITGSIRYDKNSNFDGRFTPRFSALIKIKEDNNIRISYQTAYRFPSTQDQYINLVTGGANRLIGGLPQFETFFNLKNNPGYTSASIVNYRESYAAGTPNPALLKVAQFTTVKPETMQSFEIGYKTLINKKLLIDVYGYYSRYQNFIARVAVGRGVSGNPNKAAVDLVSPFTTDNLSFVTNTSNPVKAIGYGIGAEYYIVKNYVATANFFSDELKDVEQGLITFFNAPKYRFNIGLGNSNVYKGIGFNLNYKWQDKINWEGTFGSGEVPAYGTMDFILSYKISKIRSMFKVGASNLFNNYYRSAFGNPEVGGMYYASFGYNVF